MKAKQDITIIQIEDATAEKIEAFRDAFKQAIDSGKVNPILTNAPMKMFKIEKGEVFEIKTHKEFIKKVDL